MFELIWPVAIGVVLFFAIGFVLASLYTRSSRDEAYVRTGLGGQKVVLDGGSIVLPIFHSIARVNLKTLRLEVRRGEGDALITKDRMRVDIGAEFYVRVKPDASSIALAAQTLGDRTNDAEQLRILIEAKFVDGLRSVAATMTLDALQEQRMDFVKAVQEAVGADLQSNGLELESVSLTRLDQTDIKHFNANNFFDAHGLAALTRITEGRKKERNEIVRDTEVAIAQKDLEARQQSLTIERTKREAELSQERDIANKSAATRAETAQQEQAAKRAEEEARIAAEQAIAEREATAKQARESANIDASRAVRQRDTEAQRDLQIVSQESAIAVANKSREESEARARAETARALAIAAEEKVHTAKAVEIAEREKLIAVIDARKKAETEATAVTVGAEAEKQAATDQADAIKTLALAEADAAIIKAKGDPRNRQGAGRERSASQRSPQPAECRHHRIRNHPRAHPRHPGCPCRSRQADREDLGYPHLRHRRHARPRRCGRRVRRRDRHGRRAGRPASRLSGKQADPGPADEGSRFRRRQCDQFADVGSRCTQEGRTPKGVTFHGCAPARWHIRLRSSLKSSGREPYPSPMSFGPEAACPCLTSMICSSSQL